MRSFVLLLLSCLGCFGQAFSFADPTVASWGGAPVSGSSSLLTDLAVYWKLDEPGGTNGVAETTYKTSVGTNDLYQIDNQHEAGSMSGVVSNAVVFTNALQDLIYAPDSPELSMGAGVHFTIAGWFYLMSTNAGGEGVFNKWTGDTNKREYGLIEVDLGGGSIGFQFRVRKADDTPGTTVTASTYGRIHTNVWIFIVCYYDGVNIGISVNNGAFDTSAFTGDVLDGIQRFELGEGTNGQNTQDVAIDEFGIWKRVLTAGEITTLYNSGSGKTYPFP